MTAYVSSAGDMAERIVSKYHNIIKPYLTSAGRAVNKFNQGCGKVYDTLRPVTNALHCVDSIARFANHRFSAIVVIVGPLDIAQGISSMIRWIPAIEQTITLKFIFVTNEDGSFATDDNGEKIVRPFLVIIRDSCFNTARLLNPIAWGHRIHLYDLGKHGSRIGMAVTFFYTAGGVAAFIAEVKEFDKVWGLYQLGEKDYTDVQIQILNAGNSFIQMIVSPVENGAVQLEKVPLIGIIGYGANAIAGMVDIGTGILTDFLDTHRPENSHDDGDDELFPE